MARRDDPDKSLARSLGEFVGHIWSGMKTKPGSTDRREVSRRVDEREAQTPAGKVTLRRTVIEEVEVKRDRDGG